MLFLDHLDSTGDLYHHTFTDDPVHTLSASIFLPKQSVFSLGLGHGKKDEQHKHAPRPSQQPSPTSRPNDMADDAMVNTTDLVIWSNAEVALPQHCIEWEVLSRDFNSHGGSMGIMSGYTSVDERNFFHRLRFDYGDEILYIGPI